MIVGGRSLDYPGREMARAGDVGTEIAPEVADGPELRRWAWVKQSNWMPVRV